MDLETQAFEGFSIDFEFNSNKPTFGDLFLIVGFENPNFSPNSYEFEQLSDLGFEQTDDYFGIKNFDEGGDEIKLWLFPLINGKEVHHNEGPFDALRLSYAVVRNKPETAELFEKVYEAFTSKLDVTTRLNGKAMNDFKQIRSQINQVIEYCENELKVDPGSDEALMLDW